MRGVINESEVMGRSHDNDNMANVVCPDYINTTQLLLIQNKYLLKGALVSIATF